jgi:hypothetical protein
MNRREQTAARLRSLGEQLEGVVPDEAEQEELLLPLREGAAHVERFLKRLAIGLGLRATLKQCIDRLGKLGLPPPLRANLHKRRSDSPGHRLEAA